MALDSNDLAMLHGMGFSPYEQVKIGYMQNKKASGTSIGALATAVGAGVLAIGGAAWAASTPTLTIGTSVASPTGAMPCANITNCIAITTTLNVTTGA